MSISKYLGKHTATLASHNKQAGALSSIVGAIPKLIGRGLKHPSWGVKGLAVAAPALGGAAVNEGLAANNLWHLKLDDDKMWSPNAQHARNANAGGVFGALKEMFKRPVQYMTNTDTMPRDPMSFIDFGDEKGNFNINQNIKSRKFDPATGKVKFELTGSNSFDLPPSVAKYWKQQASINAMMGGGNNNNNSNANLNKDIQYGVPVPPKPTRTF